MLREAGEDVAYEDGVDIGIEVAAKRSASVSLFEHLADAAVESMFVLTQCCAGVGREPVFDAGGMVSMSSDGHHVADQLLEFVFGLVDNAQ